METTQKTKKEIKVDLTPEGLAPWSYSKMKTLRKCPFQFYLKYILKLKPDEPPPISLVTEVGKAAHLIIENVIMGKSITDSYKIARQEFIDKKLIKPSEWNEHVETLEMSITKFREKLDAFEINNPVKRYIQELKVAVTRGWEPTTFWGSEERPAYFRGVVDLIIQLDNGDLVIIDHKTGAPAIMGLKNFQDQLDTYKVLFHYGIESITGAQAGIHFIKDGELKLGEYHDIKEIEGNLRKRLQFQIEGAIDFVKELGYFKHISNSGCQYCDFREACKGKTAEMVKYEKESKKWFEIKPV